MIPLTAIQSFADRVAAQFHPERIVLFGSQARGTADKHSDVDILVLMPFEGRSIDQAIKIRCSVEASFPLDLLVRTSEDFADRSPSQEPLFREIMLDGKLLYENRSC